MKLKKVSDVLEVSKKRTLNSVEEEVKIPRFATYWNKESWL